MAEWRDQYAGCPFFKSTLGPKKEIRCYGIIPDRSSIILKYSNKSDFEIQFNTFCCKMYQNCEVYSMLNAIYDEEE